MDLTLSSMSKRCGSASATHYIISIAGHPLHSQLGIQPIVHGSNLEPIPEVLHPSGSARVQHCGIKSFSLGQKLIKISSGVLPHVLISREAQGICRGLRQLFGCLRDFYRQAPRLAQGYPLISVLCDKLARALPHADSENVQTETDPSFLSVDDLHVKIVSRSAPSNGTCGRKHDSLAITHPVARRCSCVLG
jgi:hypothetical protein